MSVRRQSRALLFAVAVLVAFAVAAPSALAQSFYASCTECHTLSVDEARGFLEKHSQAFVPEFPEAVCGNCHDPIAHETTSWPPYWWWTPLDPYAYPDFGPSVTAQTCNSCHNGSFAPLPSSHHATDIVPYAAQFPEPPDLPYPPPLSSILPLFTAQGHQDQNPNVGGFTCATCHDAHEPGWRNPATGKFSFGRISTDTVGPSCTWCHYDQGPPAPAHDLFIDRGSDSVTFTRPTGQSFVDVAVTIRNRGNAFYYGGLMEVSVEMDFQPPLSLGTFPISSIPADWSAVVEFPWDASELTQGAVFHFRPDFGQPQTLNPDRPTEFIRTYVPPPPPPPLEAPQDLTTTGAGPSNIDLTWIPPPGSVESLTYEVYRDGRQVNTYPVFGTFYTDGPLSPETPHIYTVRAVASDGRISAMSNRAGAMTTQGNVFRVPQDFATIQEAMIAAYPGTSIHVAPGTYEEPIDFRGKSGISLVGQDAEGCTLDFTSGVPGFIDLNPAAETPNSFSGFTVRRGTVMMGPGDAVARIVFREGTYDAVVGGGLVTNCVFDGMFGAPGSSRVFVLPGQFMTVANSVFLGSNPIQVDPNAGIYLLHNSFDAFDFTSLPGEGSFMGFPPFPPPWPPTSYVISSGPWIDGGFDVGLPVLGLPDVGAFEAGFPYTPGPPSNLVAAWDESRNGIRLTWALSPDDPYSASPSWNSVAGYRVYRSEFPEAGFTGAVYAMLPIGQREFVDPAVAPGVTYSYQVRAWEPAPWPLDQLLSLPTNTASAAVNFAPTGNPDFYTTVAGASLFVAMPGVLGNDYDPDGDPLTATLVTPPVSGSVVELNPDGSFTYSPAPGFTGPDTFTYAASDGSGAAVPVSVSISVSASNAPPVLLPIGPRIVAEGYRIVVPIAATDPDPGDVLVFSVPGLPPFCTWADSGGGNAVIDCSPGFYDAGVYPVMVTVSDNGMPILSDGGTFELTVANTNRLPSAANDTWTVDEDTSRFVPAPGLLANDSDPDGDSLTVTVVAYAAHGSVILGAGGSFTYYPASNYNGLDTFTYKVNDGFSDSDVATVSITVQPKNDAPVAQVESYSVDEDGTLTVPAPGVLGNDSDIDGDAIFMLNTMPTLHGDFDFNQDGSFTYTPAANFGGMDSFKYRAVDGASASAEIVVLITVNDRNDAPVLAPIGNRTVAETASLQIPLSAADPDAMDTLTLSAAGLPGFCSFTWNPNRTGSINCAPGYDHAGPYEVTVTVADSAPPNLSDAETFTLTVTNTNRPPSATGDSWTVNEDGGLVVTAPGVLANDADPDGQALTATLATNVSNGSLALNADGSFTYTPASDFNGSDSFTYTASDGLLLSSAATVAITVAPVNDAPRVSDPGGQSGTEGETVSLQIVAQDPEGSPITFGATGLPDGLVIGAGTGLVSGTLSFSSAGTHTVTVTATDGTAASQAVFTWSVADVPRVHVDSIAIGERVEKGKTIYTAVVLVQDDGSQPAPGAAVAGHWTGSGADSTSIVATTGANGSAAFPSNGIRQPAGGYTFTVDGVVKAGFLYDVAGSVTSAGYPPSGGSPPVANGDADSTTTGTPVTIAVLANDTDPDSDPLTVTNLTQPAHGTATANGNGTVTYTPAPGYTGTDSFTYTAHDGTFDSSPALVTVSITAPPAGGAMHVAAIAMSLSGTKSVKSSAAVTVVDAAGAAVAGVTVSGNWTGATSAVSSGVTDAKGTITLSSPAVRNASGKTFTFTVTGLAKNGWTYDAGANAETSDSITAP